MAADGTTRSPQKGQIGLTVLHWPAESISRSPRADSRAGFRRRDPRGHLDNGRFLAYTFNMKAERHRPTASQCLCNALRQASRAVKASVEKVAVTHG
jgi:hypothetical protein